MRGIYLLAVLAVAGCARQTECRTEIQTLRNDDYGNSVWLVERKCPGPAPVLDKGAVPSVPKEGERVPEAVER